MTGMELGMTVMWMAHIVAILVRLLLWTAVAVVGLWRGGERARVFFVAAGVAGALYTVAIPVLQGALSAVMTPNFDLDAYGLTQAGLTALATVFSLVPWGLLVFGIWRTGRVADPE